MIDDAGLAHVEVEFLSDWWTDGERRRASDRVRHELFEAATALGARTVKVAGELDHLRVGPPVPRDAMVTAFAALAADAAAHGLRVALEPLPMSDVRTLADGVAIVTDCRHPAGGLTVDVWHVARGGTSYEDAARAARWTGVRGRTRRRPRRGRRDAVGRHPRPAAAAGAGRPGGRRFVRALHDAGWRGPWGVEMHLGGIPGAPADGGADRRRDSTLAVLDAAERAEPAAPTPAP